MIATLAAAWTAPIIDYHALAPELVLAAGICAILLVDLFLDDSRSWVLSSLAGFTLLGAVLPVITLALDDTSVREMFDGRYVVDEFSLVLKGLFLVAGYVVVLLSSQHLEDEGQWKGEYWFLLLSSILGMVMMSSSRDLVSVFVALEFLSIPAYMLVAWRKRDRRSNEAGVKYFLLGVFASAVMLYGMSLLYGTTNSTMLAEIGSRLSFEGELAALNVLGTVFVVVGFAFKVSAVPFHTWAPDTYEGAPTPMTAFLSVASKSGGFVALLTVVFVAFPAGSDVWQPLIWVLAALTMTVGNVLALRQTNIVRMLAYSSISQGGFVLMPLAVAGTVSDAPLRAVVLYLLLYAATNLGLFAIVIAVSRTTRSGLISSWGGLFSYAPGLGTLATVFLASLAGIPPFGGWIAKFVAFQALLEAGTGWGYALALVGAVNSVIAFGYYGVVLREIWMKPVPEGVPARADTPGSLSLALAITGAATVVLGVLPSIGLNLADVARFTITGGAGG